MDIITLDWETFYDDEYSLSKMQMDAYVLDPRFEIIGVGVKHNDNKAHWLTDGKIEREFRKVPWKDVAVLAHNCPFDAFILEQKFGIRPKLWIDTRGMAVALYPYLPSHSLDALSTHFNLGVKGKEVIAAKGKRKADFTPAELHAYGEYCKNDCNLEKKLYDLLAPRFPVLEFALVDMTIRMFTEPLFQLNVPKLEAYRDLIVRNKQALETGVASVEIAALLARDGGTVKDLIMSNPKFAQALEALGVEPPRKISKTTNKVTFAFAKTDRDLTDLLEHPNPDVQALVAARLGVKTTIAETRAQKLIETGQRDIGLPVYLHYWGAKKTGRMSGGNQINMMNIPNRGTDRVIRESMEAPPGYVVVVGDSANIELRCNMVLSGQWDKVEKIKRYDAQGTAATSDLYCDFATELFGRPITKADKLERTVGKVAELSLGYGAAAATFQNMLRIQGGVDYTLDQCERIVSLYRRGNDKVVELWRYLGTQTLQHIANSDVLQPVDVNGWFLTTHEGFSLPGHIGVVYHDLRRNSENEWEYQLGRSRVKIYSGKVGENLNQHAARHIVMWQSARVNRRYPVKLSVYDEIVCVVPEADGPACAAYMLECLQMAPAWCRGVMPLNGEVGIGKTYGEAK